MSEARPVEKKAIKYQKAEKPATSRGFYFKNPLLAWVSARW
jgi:hypothetical protein